MAVPRLPRKAVRLDDQVVPWDQFDDLFWRTVHEGPMPNGYVVLSGPDEAGYLFVANGAPFGAGRYEEGRFSSTTIKEFFEFYRRGPGLALSACETDMGLIRGLLALIQKQPTQQFSTDLVDVHEAMGKVAAKGVNAVITYRAADRVGVSLLLKGQLQVNYFSEDPADVPQEANPLDCLLVYVYGKTEEGPVTVAIFEEPKVAPAPDAVQVKPAERPRLTQRFVSSRPAATGPTPELVLMLSGKTLGKFPMAEGQLTIGRDPSNGVVIDNLGVSRRHAVVRAMEGRYVLEDRGSANGTFVNGERIAEPRELRDGDQITIVKHTILFQIPRPGAAPPTGPVEMAGDQTMYVGPAATPKAVPAAPGPSAAAPAAPGPQPRPAGTPKLILADLSELPLTKALTTFGSGPEADIRTEGFMIAKLHARIEKDKEGRCRFVKMGKMGHTRINAQSMETKPLRNGDVIEIGKNKFIFRVE